MGQRELLLDFWKNFFEFNDVELQAFLDTDRSLFIPKELQHFAYEDSPLPILRGKTISQPTTVMIMTAALDLKNADKVFEVGTGSGYQSAIIARIVGKTGKVISAEVIPELITFAKENLKKANIDNVKIIEGDGSVGFIDESPFDKIIITAACSAFPKNLIEQLKVGGIIVAPIGDREEQQIIKATKQQNGNLQMEFLGPFQFSPLYGKYGFEI